MNTETKSKRKKEHINDHRPIENQRYTVSPQNELNGLFERGVFQIVKEKDVGKVRIFGSRFVDSVKNEGILDAVENPVL